VAASGAKSHKASKSDKYIGTIRDLHIHNRALGAEEISTESVSGPLPDLKSAH
jgi:hypothetical protein